MPLLPLNAYGFAATFKMRDLARSFPGAKVRQAKTQVVAELGVDQHAVAFDFGALVLVNVSAEERARIIGLLLSTVATDEPHAPLEEDFFVEVDPTAPAEGRVHFDRVVVPELSAPIVDLVTLLLAQSVAIDYYEEDLQEIISSLDKKTGLVAKTGKIAGSTRDLTRFVGSSLDTKNQIFAALAVLVKPAVTWDSESLDRLYRDLRLMLV
ncbi:MAG: RMD1 family protein, partial [Deltaproteobacteria bacterium]|nr:RMD1 family protein [Deltaproteobacteria bacterium]